MPSGRKMVDTLHPYRLRQLAISEIEEALEYEVQYPTIAAGNEPLPRAEQLAKAACQAIAGLKWMECPDYTVTALAEHPDIVNAATGAIHYQPRTVYGWIAEVRPPSVRKKAGRPRKAQTQEK